MFTLRSTGRGRARDCPLVLASATVSSTPWNLQKELAGFAKLAEGSSLNDSLSALGMIDRVDEFLELVELGPWYRGGAETYLLEFEVRCRLASSRYVLKACVALGNLTGTAAIVDEWQRRRTTLERSGANVSRVFGVYRSTLIEEWIPFSLPDAFCQAESLSDRAKICKSLGRTAGVLTRLGFPALSIADIRSRGADAVMIDFGEDLGPPSLAGTDHSVILDQALDLVSATASSDELRLMSETFEHEMRRTL